MYSTPRAVPGARVECPGRRRIDAQSLRQRHPRRRLRAAGERAVAVHQRKLLVPADAEREAPRRIGHRRAKA